MKKMFPLVTLVVLAALLGGCPVAPSNSSGGVPGSSGLTTQQLAAAKEVGSVPFFEQLNACKSIPKTVATPSCQPEWNWVKTICDPDKKAQEKKIKDTVDNLWVKKDWGDIVAPENAITIELYEEVKNGDIVIGDLFVKSLCHQGMNISAF